MLYFGLLVSPLFICGRWVFAVPFYSVQDCRFSTVIVQGPSVTVTKNLFFL